MFEFSPYFSEFIMLIFAMFLAVISPGPDFAFILKQSIKYGKKTSIYTSLGIGLGISVHILYTILGIGLIISKSVILFNIIKFLGAGYLIYLGYKSLSSSGTTMDNTINKETKKLSNKKAFILGFLCNALNPKATIFFLSLFTVIIDINTPLIIQSIYGLTCIFITSIWFIFLSLILSSKKVREFFNSFGKYFDKTIGLTLILFGIKVAFSKTT